LVRKIQRAGHEIGSHGYAHVLAYEVGQQAFEEDIIRSKSILEDLTGSEVIGFRSPGFCVRQDSLWVFDAVAKAGYRYDASVFPAHHGHGGLAGTPVGPYLVSTPHGPLVEIPVSTVKVLGRRVCCFGGGYLRLAPLPVIQWGVRQLHQEGRPLVVYVHPREIDPDHPRLRLTPWRYFKCYVNLRSTLPKLTWLLNRYRFTALADLSARVAPSPELVLSEAPGSLARASILAVGAAHGTAHVARPPAIAGVTPGSLDAPRHQDRTSPIAGTHDRNTTQ
jgi:polysaccharide deacetylase family protein (PEP-CTERM system associated)